ncbi:hypothetical protein [Blautia sp.]|uniref:hypothetical protein n=1 Tax=Blautia sp. TaxID=1955243 RepID=UPI003AB1A78F
MLEKIMNLQILFCIMAAAGAFGAVGMLAVHLTYRRILRRTNAVTSLKEKWLNLWKTRDKLLNRMNLLVWIPSLLSTGCLVLAVWFVTRLDWTDGLPLRYLYLGTVIPVGLMVLRQALDFAYREELVMNSLADYILSVKTRREETVTSRKSEPVVQPVKVDPVLQEEMVEKITASIRQTAATGSHFSKMLSPEEEEIMREIIREFME